MPFPLRTAPLMLPLQSPVAKRLLAISFLLSFVVVTLQVVFTDAQVSAVSYDEGVAAAVGVVDRNTYQADKIPNGFYEGISAGFFFNEETNEKPGLISDNIRRVRATGELLAFDVLKALNDSSDRAAALYLYVEQLQTEATLITRIRAENKALTEDYRANIRTLNNDLKVAKKAYSEALKNQVPDAAQLAFDRMQQIQAQIEPFEETRRAISRFDGQYSQALSTMQKRYTFLTANRDAVLKGVRVVNVSDTQIKLIFSRSEWERLAQ